MFETSCKAAELSTRPGLSDDDCFDAGWPEEPVHIVININRPDTVERIADGIQNAVAYHGAHNRVHFTVYITRWRCA